MSETCREEITSGWGYGHQVCGRKIKADGLCGIHLAAQRKRDENAARSQAKMERSDRAKANALHLADELGVEINPDYVTGQGYSDTHVVISRSDLLKLAKREDLL